MNTSFLEPRLITILIVEDELTISFALEKKLKKFGYDTVTTVTGEEAIEVINSEIPVDLIIMDIDLGSGIDGTVAAQRILEIIDLPIIFHSSHSEKEYIEKVRGITRYGFIAKNSEEYILESTIEMALDLHSAYKNIQEKEESLSITFQSIGDAVISANLSGQVVRMNPKAEYMTGWTLEEALGRDVSEIFQICNSITRESVENPFHKVIKTGEVVGLANHTILIRKDKKEFHIADSAAPIKDAKGVIQGIIVVFSDISDNYKYQEEIRKSEERYRALVDNLTAGITVHSPDGTLIYSNPKASEILGLTKEQLQGKKIVDPYWAFLNEDESVMAFEDYPIIRLFTMKIPLQNYLVGLRIPNRTNPVWGLCNGYLVYDDDGNASQGVITFHEVTARIEAEKRVKSSSKWYEHLVESINGIVWEADPVTKELTFISKHAENALGYTVEEWKEPLFWENHIFEEDREEVLRKFNELSTKLDNYEVEYRFYSKDGDVLWMRDIIRVNSVNGIPVSLNGILIDITNRKINELKVNQLLKDKEVLLKEIHHRVKNNMSTISGLLSLQADSLEDPEVQNILKDAESRVRSMVGLYDRLFLSPSYNEVSAREYLSSLLDEIVRVYNIHKPIKIIKEIDDIEFDSKAIFNLGIVVNEVVANSMKYAFSDREDGVLYVSLKKEIYEIVIKIKDNGKGFRKDDPERVSSGFGLSLIDILTRQMKGESCYEEGEGTSFLLKFPIP